MAGTDQTPRTQDKRDYVAFFRAVLLGRNRAGAWQLRGAESVYSPREFGENLPTLRRGLRGRVHFEQYGFWI